MKTKLLKIHPFSPQKDRIELAAACLKAGGLVAFPTETVYGLGANGFNENDVKNIFLAKGRPADNPLILHVSNLAQMGLLAENISPLAQKLIKNFWPGPLTLIFKKSRAVCDAVCAGLDTVALRMPSHPVALALIAAADLPVAAPSANLSGRPSPTTAQHVMEDLNGRVDLILDAGISNVGLESTVLDVSVFPPKVLRPGGVTIEQLLPFAPNLLFEHTGVLLADIKSPRSPGMKYTHYSPKAPLYIVTGKNEKVIEVIRQKQGETIGILTFDEYLRHYDSKMVLSLGSEDDLTEAAKRLFSHLREFDKRGMTAIYSHDVLKKGIGLSVCNRLYKAAGNKFIHC